MNILAKGTKNFQNKHLLLKDKFSVIVNQQSGPPVLDKANSVQNHSFYQQSIKELKKNDLFDLGVVLLLCATSGFDMINEEYLERLCDYSMQCCIIHAI